MPLAPGERTPCHRTKRDPASRPLGSKKKPLRRADGWPIDRFAVIERAWEGTTVLCIGGGPSLTEKDLSLVQGRYPTIAVNDQYLVAPWADVCYFADARWWEWHDKGIPKVWPWVRFSAVETRERFAGFQGQKCTIWNTGMMVKDPEVFMLQDESMQTGQAGGLSKRPNALRSGRNSGYQAANLALLAGAKRVLLLGYDMRFPNGKSHSHDGHPYKHGEDSYRGYARNFDAMMSDLRHFEAEIINLTPGSAITCFPRASLEGVLTNP